MNNSAFGSTKRKTKRDHSRKITFDYISEQIKNLISSDLPELENKPINETIYQEQIQKLIKKLEKDYPHLDHYRIARNCLSYEINEGNKKGSYYLDVPPYVIQAKRGVIFRTEKWFQKSKELNQWKFLWCKSLSSTVIDESHPSSEYLLTSSLLSAAIFGGLCIPEAIVSLANQLTQKKQPLLVHGKLVWLDLVFKASSQDANFKPDEDKEALTLRRWYPDPVSLAWIHYFLKTRDKNIEIEKYNQRKCWRLMSSHINSILTLKVVLSLKSFCVGATGVLENLEGVKLPTTLIEYISGRLASSSLTANYQEGLLVTHFEEINKIDFKRFELTYKKNNINNQQRVVVGFKYEKTLKLIRNALKEKQLNGIKRTQEMAIEALKNIEVYCLPDFIGYIIFWLIYILDERELTVSSANTYFNNIGTLWLAHTAELSLSKLDEESFESLYILMMGTAITEQSRRDKMALLMDIHDFGVKEFDFPILTSDTLNSKSKILSFVRVGVISELLFAQLCKALNSLSNLDRLSNQGIVCLVLLSYRLGLRRVELLKLQLSDIEDSDEHWVYIRANQFGDNKTSSSLRKIPLSILLTKEENSFFRAYLAERKTVVSNSPNSLIFSKSHTPTLPFDGNSISTLVSSILRMLSGLPFVFHHLRHSALSRLHLVIEGHKAPIREFTQYEDEQVDEIQKMLLSGSNNSTPRDNYWALAGIAGHITPETTFSNYLHFVDRVLFERIYHSDIKFSITELKAISGISSNFLTRLCKKENVMPEAIPVNKLYSKIVSEISPFAIQISTKNKIDMHEDEYKLKFDRTIDTKLCLEVLGKVEQGVKIAELVYDYQIKEELIEKWIKKAKELSNKKTAKGSSKLLKKYNTVKRPHVYLCPQKPQSKGELQDADDAISKLRSLYKYNNVLILWCIDYFIGNTTRSSTAIHFKKKKEFEKFIVFVLQIFPKKRWTLHLELIENSKYDDQKQINDWTKVSQKIPILQSPIFLKNSRMFPEGRVSLYLNHVHEKTIISSMKKTDKVAKKYSTPVLRYIFHTLAIML